MTRRRSGERCWRAAPAAFRAAGRRKSGLKLRLLALMLGLMLGLTLLPGGAARAQIRPDSARLALKADVARLFHNTYELEAEYGLTSRLSLLLAPHLRGGTVSGLVSRAAHEAGDQVSGFGGRGGGRYYFWDKGTAGARLAGWYAGLRGEYQRLDLRRDGVGWGEDLAADGLRYYVYRRRQSAETIRRGGGTLSLGFQGQALVPRLRLDVGANLHYLHSRSSAAGASHYRTSRRDYAHSGLFWTLGVGLGLVLR